MQEIIDSFKRLAASNKFKALMGSVMMILSQDTDPGILNVSPDSVKLIVAAVMVYMGAQGVADHGKEKAKIEKAAASLPRK